MATRPPLVDTELVAALERAFAAHAGDDSVLDVAELKRALGIRSELLTLRLLAALDRNGDGVISHDEFVRGVKELVFGSEREKLAFAFRLHDLNGDGYIDRSEILRMISLSLGESDLHTRASMPPERLGEALLSSGDTDRDGRISFDEFETLLKKRPELIDRMTRAEVTWIVPGEDLLARLEAPLARTPLRRLLENHWPRYLFFTGWILAIATALVVELFFSARDHAPMSMRVARTASTSASVTAALILFPVLRRLLTRVRATRLHRVVPVDDAILFHKVLGHSLFFLSAVHGAASMVAYAGGHPRFFRMFTGLPGATGLALFVVFTVMWAFALEPVRRSRRFEIFYFTHLLYVAWILLALVHAPSLLLFMGLSLIGLVRELALRAWRRGKKTQTIAAHALRSGVVRLDIARPKGFSSRAGDYVFLRIPEIARHEWHPFTLSSAPEREALTIHARSLGNWTSALRRLVEVHERAEGAKPIGVYVDGPYGSPSGHVFGSRYAVFIAAGIGVTPFASILSSLVQREKGAAMHLQKAHFFWLNRDQYSFEWFVELLRDLEARDDANLLDLHLCMTDAHMGGASVGLEIAREILHAETERDLVTGLRTRTHFGHPDWEIVLAAIREEHRGAEVDVFFCGPRGLGAKLRPICDRLGLSFREELF